MKIEFFHTMNYWGQHGDSWPAPPRICETDLVSATIEHGLIECAAALEAGFDALNFAEHHYSPKQLTPNPIILAAVAGRKFPEAQIGVFGTDLPLNNPVRIAEEYSMLDNLLDGRLRIGMLRGTPNEYLTYGSNPWESRDRYEEGILLLKACFTEPEPFGWEGRYYRYRNIAVWPRRVQDPHPRILISGNSKDGAIFAGLHGLDLGFSYMPAAKCAEHADLYRQAAAQAGWEPTADNVQYRHFMYVTPTDDEAQETMKALSGGGLMSLFKGASPDIMMTMAQIGAALGGVPKHVVIDPSMAPPMTMGPPLYGSPETVLATIKEIHDVLGMGRLEVSLGTVNPLPHDSMLSSLKLIGEEIVPELHRMSELQRPEREQRAQS